MKIENFTKLTVNEDLEVWINKEDVRINKAGVFGGSSICLSFNELQDIVNAINGKKIEQETFNAFEGAVHPVQPLTADVIKRAVKKLKEGGQMYG